LSLHPGLALIFDMDGVIIDSMPMHAESWRRYLARHGVAVDRLSERMHGRFNDEIVADFFGEHLTLAEREAHGAAKEALYRELMEPVFGQYLVPGIQAFLARYGEHPMGLGTNAEIANVDFVLDQAKIRPWFQAIVPGGRVQRPKPFPDVYLRAAELLGVAPENAIVFEDSPAGVQAARSAGARVVGIETYGPLDQVDFAVAHFADPALNEWLAQQKPGITRPREASVSS
jgi:beta-phosphoglucomutase-like phosphatase (HAD superfamily)